MYMTCIIMYMYMYNYGDISYDCIVNLWSLIITDFHKSKNEQLIYYFTNCNCCFSTLFTFKGPCTFRNFYKLLSSCCSCIPNAHSFVVVHLYTINMWLTMWAYSSEVEPVLLAASVSFLSPVMLHPSKNCDRNKTGILNNPVLESFYSQSRREQHW